MNAEPHQWKSRDAVTNRPSHGVTSTSRRAIRCDTPFAVCHWPATASSCECSSARRCASRTCCQTMTLTLPVSSSSRTFDSSSPRRTAAAVTRSRKSRALNPNRQLRQLGRAAPAASRQALAQQRQRVAAQRQASTGVVEHYGFAFGRQRQLGLLGCRLGASASSARRPDRPRTAGGGGGQQRQRASARASVCSSRASSAARRARSSMSAKGRSLRARIRRSAAASGNETIRRRPRRTAG